jgi:hypothetical protein
MKYPKWNGMTRPSTYILSLVFFFVGFALISAVSLGQIKYDDSEGPGWNPVSRLPDGKVGLSAIAIETVGLALLVIVCTVIALSRR